MIFVEGMLPTARERLVTIRHDAPLMAAARLLDDSHIKQRDYDTDKYQARHVLEN